MRKDYILTDQKIKNAYVDIIKAEKRIPTQEKVAKLCGISRDTVSRHLNRIDLAELVQPFRIFGNDVLMGLRNKAITGDVQAAKLFFMLIYDWNEKTALDVSVKQIQPIKINTRESHEERTKSRG